MPIYEVRADSLTLAQSTNFAAEKLQERGDLQRLLRANITCLGEGLMVLAEEFSGWQDSARRIDLLCLDQDANLVVVELKRDEDGGHMDLQAVRYAAMVSPMSFTQAVDALAHHTSPDAPNHDKAQEDILGFLNWDAPDQARFGVDTRIILASADFSKEVTTTALWLRERDIDIRCVRMKPYRLEDGRVLMDIQSIVPLPEAAAYQTQLGEKRMAERRGRSERHDLRLQFWESLLAKAKLRTTLHSACRAGIGTDVSVSIGNSWRLAYGARRDQTQVHLWLGDDKATFHRLLADQGAIEAEFGGPLEWQDLQESTGARIRCVFEGGYRSGSNEWPRLQDQMIAAMIRLDSAIRPRLATGGP